MEETQTLNNEQKEVAKEKMPKWGLVVWFGFTEQIIDEEDGEEIIGFKEVVGIHTLGFETQKEAVAYKDKIWTKGYQLQDEIGKDWARVIRVRIVNNYLAKEVHKQREASKIVEE